MLVLKIMSDEDYADADPCKGFRLVSNVIDVKFFTGAATEYEKSMMGYKGEGELVASFAECNMLDSTAIGGQREGRYLLTGNCYVLNDRGKTIESFWARRNSQGELVKEY